MSRFWIVLLLVPLAKVNAFGCPLGAGWIYIDNSDEDPVCLWFSSDIDGEGTFEAAQFTCSMSGENYCPAKLLSANHIASAVEAFNYYGVNPAVTKFRVNLKYNRALQAYVDPFTNQRIIDSHIRSYVQADGTFYKEQSNPDDDDTVLLLADKRQLRAKVGPNTQEAYICESCATSGDTWKYCPLNEIMAGWKLAGNICYLASEASRDFYSALSICYSLGTYDCPSRLIRPARVSDILMSSHHSDLAEWDVPYIIDAMYSNYTGQWTSTTQGFKAFFPPTMVTDENAPYEDDVFNVYSGSVALVNFRSDRIQAGDPDTVERFLCESCAAPIPECGSSCNSCVRKT